MRNDPYLVSAVLGVELEKYCRPLGIDLSAACSRLNIDKKVFTTMSGRLPCLQFARLLEELAVLADDPLFSFKFGLQCDIGAYGPVFHCIQRAKNLRSAWDVIVKFRHLGFNFAKLDLITDGSTSKILWGLSPYVSDMPQIFDYSVVVANRMYQVFREPNNDFLQVHLTRTTPKDRCLFEALLNVKVEFERPENSVILPTALLDKPNPNADRMLFSYMKLQCEAVDKIYELSRPIEVDVRSAILNALHQGEPSLEHVAASLAKSPRSLQRQLGANGLSFSHLLDDVRKDYATHLLCNNTNSIEKISELVGFKSASVFSRVATEWYSESPTSHRKKLRQQFGFD